MWMDLLALALVLFLSFVFVNNKKDPKKVFGVYSRPGKWYFIKYPVLFCLLTLRRLQFFFVGKEQLVNVEELEKVKPLSDHENAFDAVFLHAISQNGIYICGGMERRQEAKVSGLLYILLPEYGLLCSEKMPSCNLRADSGSLMSGKEWGAEGFKMVPVKPMTEWNVSFKGKMRLARNPEHLVEVDLEANWTSDGYPWFLYESEIPIKMLASSMAREPWSRQYFDTLKDAHQTHYEQHGYLNGTVKVDGKEVSLKLDAFRDHSFGFKRDWSLMHRYIFHMFYLSNQMRVVLGIVSQPCTGSHLEMGYVVHPNKHLDVIEDCDLLLYQHGENGRPAEDLCFTFVAGGVTYEGRVNYETTHVHYKGKNDEAKMFERFITCTVNGVKGRGISEWHYNVNDLPKEYR